ncbi:MAG: sulfatase [Smithellaceae bacterium]|nr:sulfatase [Smithellaceae bacterium]
MSENRSRLFDGRFTRRETLRLCGAAAVAGLVDWSLPFPAGARERRPNIIFILSDDHRWDYMSCMGHPFLKTPNLDHLAATGVHFRNAFVTTSLCSPSRASFLTGQYAHNHGVRNNLTMWRDNNVTFLELLKKTGYDTAFIGKWHMPGAGLPELRGVDEFISFTVQEGQGRYFDCPLYINGVLTERRGKYITDDLTDFALDFIEKKRTRPFCLYLSHKAIHHQFLPPPDLDNLYADADVRLPKEADPWVTMTAGMTYTGTFGPMPHLIRKYCATITGMDRQIGRVLKKLDDLGIADDTIIVYAGDNGYFWGEHHLVDKRWAYEEAIRIPFIVRYPRLIRDPGRKAPQMVLNIDLAPTLLDLAGLRTPNNMDGVSFKPILAAAGTRGRKAWLYEYFKDFPYNVPEIRAVRTDRHCYMEYVGRRNPELYDVISDPREMNNLFGTPAGEALLPGLRDVLAGLKRGQSY